MREIRSSGSVEGVMSNHDPYSDRKRRSDSILKAGENRGRTGSLPRSPASDLLAAPLHRIEAIHRLPRALHRAGATLALAGLGEWSRNGGKAGDGEGSGVILLDPCGHLFADYAAKVEVFTCVS